MIRRYPKGTRNPARCRHRWQPVSIEMPATYWRADRTSYQTSDPHLEHARVYVVCLRCASWTYMQTAFAGIRLEGSLDRAPGSWETHEYRDQLAKRAAAEEQGA